jgi:mannose-6-phosphate isomerase-like protein (cupin superfamily)
MKGFVSNIEKDTLENENFRKVLYTAKHCQLVLMALLPNEEIGMEVHPDNDQFFRIEKGMGKAIIDGNEYEITDGSAVIVPAGSQHNVVAGADGLKLYTIYSPAHHIDGIVRATKAEAEDPANAEEFDGKTTE